MNELLENWTWHPKEDWNEILVVDMHTGGEPLRIPVKGLPFIHGNSVLEKRRYFKNHYDHIRTGLLFEPRGHADMYGAIITKSTTPDADFDAFFIHNEGYSTMCGHAIIALTKFAFETGLVPKNKNGKLIINVPAGRIIAQATIHQDTVVKSSFLNVPSYMAMENQQILIPDLGTISFDIAYGGAFYVIVDQKYIGIDLVPGNYGQLIEYGRLVKNSIIKNYKISHPKEADLSFLYGTIFTGKPHNSSNHSRNVCIFADGELDRSATGSGVSARAGVHYAKGELKIGECITIESILGSTMSVEVVDTVDYEGFKAVIPKVTGSASFIGKQSLFFDPNDQYKNGFIFR